MAKIYSNGGGTESESGTPTRASASPFPAKLIPLIIGLVVLFLVIGLVIRSQTNRQTPPAAASGASETGGAARQMEAAPTQGAESAQGTTFVAPPGPKGAQATGK